QAIGRGPGDAPQQIELCERGIELVEKGSINHAKILNEMGAALGANYRESEALAALEKSAEIATAHEEIVLAAHALLNLSFTHLWSLNARKAADTATDALRLLDGNNESGFVALCSNAATFAFMMLGESEEARVHSDELIRLSLKDEKKGWPIEGFDEYLVHTFAMWQGRWSDAIAIGDRNLENSQRPWDFSARDVSELFTGDPYIALSKLSNTAHDEVLGMALDGIYRTELFGIIAESSRVLNDSSLMDRVDAWTSAFLATAPDSAVQEISIAKLSKAIIAIARKKSIEAAPLYEFFKKFRGLHLWNFRTISPDRVLALLAKTIGNNELAKTHFEEAITFSSHANYGPELAWIYHDYASMLIESGGNTNFRKSISLINHALIETDRLGMDFLGEKLRSMKVDLTPYETRPDDLTEREIEVLNFISKGSTNSEIARAIFVTENTVATHVASILSKTGTANRTEAAAYAAEKQIVPRITGS
ncbi:MAG: response regulator transcription factor, partial [Dehalococcoidia bacterium]